jgi:predicted dienelactone hydrolase
MNRVWLAAILVMLPAQGQQRESAVRADGKTTPLLVYRAAQAAGCAPLAVISHGAGGSESGYRYLAQSMADAGYTAIVMGHRESGVAALRKDVRGQGLGGGLRELVADSAAERDRLLDVGAALLWAGAGCKAPHRILLGHSMGAITVMLEAGARNIIGVASPPAGQDRFDAYVALSPEGPGIVFPEHAWGGIRKPVLILTGTRDQSLKGGARARQIPWGDLPGDPKGACQWMGVIDGATHTNFAGSGMGAERVERLVTGTIAEFFHGARTGRCAPPGRQSGMTLRVK